MGYTSVLIIKAHNIGVRLSTALSALQTTTTMRHIWSTLINWLIVVMSVHKHSLASESAVWWSIMRALFDWQNPTRSYTQLARIRDNISQVWGHIISSRIGQMCSSWNQSFIHGKMSQSDSKQSVSQVKFVIILHMKSHHKEFKTATTYRPT